MEFSFIVNVPHVLAVFWAAVAAWVFVVSIRDLLVYNRYGMDLLDLILPPALFSILAATSILLWSMK